MVRKKFQFVLKNIDLTQLERQYKIGITINVKRNASPTHQSLNITKINEIFKPEKKLVSFLSNTNGNIKCLPIFVQYKNPTKPPTPMDWKSLSNLCCYWCRHPCPENVIPVPIPIKHVPNRIVKEYKSKLRNTSYMLPEDIGNNTSRRYKIQSNKIPEYSVGDTIIHNRDYYVYDGISCSWNCAMAYICSKYHDPTFELSKMLLFELYKKFDPEFTGKMPIAPSWRLLKAYGGTQHIQQFRDQFDNAKYIYHGDTFNISIAPIIHLFEQKIVV